MSEEEKGFVVKDKRRFSDDADERENDRQAADEVSEKDNSQETSKASGKENEYDTQLPEINFGTFVLSLHSSALVQLGIMDDPVTGQKYRNLPLAKQTIDILGMLAEKTKGNLSDEEGNMIKHILFELRMLYVKEK
jgi:hypothetical protein